MTNTGGFDESSSDEEYQEELEFHQQGQGMPGGGPRPSGNA